jgi:tRNA threonylcarbamoyladenosine biosynthesis protein TsaE
MIRKEHIIFKATVSKEELIQHAASYVKQLTPGLPLLLEGDLGAGKTTWVRGLLQAAITPQLRVNSPTFSLMVPYEWKHHTIWHMDLYRLAFCADRVHDLGLDAYLKCDICLIEWPEYLHTYFPCEYTVLRLHYTQELGVRILELAECKRSR